MIEKYFSFLLLRLRQPTCNCLEDFALVWMEKFWCKVFIVIPNNLSGYEDLRLDVWHQSCLRVRKPSKISTVLVCLLRVQGSGDLILRGLQTRSCHHNLLCLSLSPIVSRQTFLRMGKHAKPYDHVHVQWILFHGDFRPFHVISLLSLSQLPIVWRQTFLRVRKCAKSYDHLDVQGILFLGAFRLVRAITGNAEEEVCAITISCGSLSHIVWCQTFLRVRACAQSYNHVHVQGIYWGDFRPGRTITISYVCLCRQQSDIRLSWECESVHNPTMIVCCHKGMLGDVRLACHHSLM